MEPLNRKELADLLGVTVRTISNHQMEMGFRNGRYDPRTAVRYWVKYVQDQKDKEYNKTDEIKQYQLTQEKAKALKAEREWQILDGEYLSKDDTRDTVLRLVHITKTKILSLKNVLTRKLKLSPAQSKVVNAELIKALDDLSKGVNQNGSSKHQSTVSTKTKRKNKKTTAK